MSWIVFWKWFLILSIGCYFVIAVAVAIGGFLGVRRMLSGLRSAPQEPPE